MLQGSNPEVLQQAGEEAVSTRGDYHERGRNRPNVLSNVFYF